MRFVALLLGIGAACWLVSRTPLTASLSDRLQAWALACAMILMAAVVSFGWMYGDDERVAWQPFSLESLQQVAVEEGKTVLVDFSAEWCLTCKALEKTDLTLELEMRDRFGATNKQVQARGRGHAIH